MISKTLKFILLLALITTVAMPASAAQERYHLVVSNPFIKKIPVALPALASLSRNGQEAVVGREVAALLEKTLAFTGYFKFTTPDAFLERPSETGISLSSINFRNWTVIGSELLVTGGVLVKGKQVILEFHFYDTIKGQQLVARRYKSTRANIRQMVLRFCSEIIKQYTGNGGYFNSKLAFISTGTGNKEVYSSDFDGFNPQKVTSTGTITLSPAWSSDGKKLAYTSYQSGKPDTYIMDVPTGTPRRLNSIEGTNITPAWVPGENNLAVSMSHEGGQGIYMLTGKGKIRKRLTKKWSEWGIDVSPSFSPDGKKMAFVSKRSGTPQIYIKYLETGRVERVTYKGRYNTTPSWSPMGDRIAYSSASNGHFDIFTIGINGEDPLQLTQDTGDNESPCWSPDGSIIAFSSTREGPSRIYVMTAYGTDPRRLLLLPGEQTNPKWSPNLIN